METIQYRQGAKRWLANIDNQCRVHLGYGLSKLIPDKKSGAWKSWKTWPYLSIAADLGSDGLAGIQALQYLWSANCDLWPDVPHGCNRDLELILKDQLCMIMSWNLPFGPRREYQRCHALSEAVQDLYLNKSMHEVPLFMAKVEGIVQCFKRNGFRLDGDDPEEQQAWELMAKRPWQAMRASRITMGRFCASLHGCKTQQPWWEVHEFERLYLAWKQTC